ncbi:STAS domain-containing protein [Occallatibacter savannae]|uniref:STAS domain-containing protein n=1 Tax=Occallatibacter savannae TaxID=1002691 RepID=UPI0013A5B2BF|nr:STAS domain-containing protein [Occallatibacter savannae]
MKREQEDVLIRLDGNLTALVVPDLQAELKNLLTEGIRRLTFDLAETAMLDSTGIGLLIAATNTAMRTGGELRVINASPEIFRLLQNMRLTARLNVSARVA